MNTLPGLIRAVRKTLRNGKNLRDCRTLLQEYNKFDDLIEMIRFNRISFNRIKLNRLRDYDLGIYLNCWGPNQETDIHSHPRNGCLSRVIIGDMYETVYEKDSYGMIVPKHHNELHTGDTSYIAGRNGIHKIGTKEKLAVSLSFHGAPRRWPDYYNVDVSNSKYNIPLL